MADGAVRARRRPTLRTSLGWRVRRDCVEAAQRLGWDTSCCPTPCAVALGLVLFLLAVVEVPGLAHLEP